MVRKECRYCRKILPKNRSRNVGGQWVEQYYRLHPTFCNCQGDVFIHRECIKEEALKSPDRCPHCRSPWNNLVILRETVNSFGDLKRKWGFWATNVSLMLSLILTALVMARLSHVPSHMHSKSETSIYLVEGINIWFVIHWIIRRLAYRVARVLNVQVAYHADVQEENQGDICRICYASVNELQRVHKIKVYQKRYFCNCNDFICETCLKSLANQYDDCPSCLEPFTHVRMQNAQPIPYWEYRSTQNSYSMYRMFLNIYICHFFLPMLVILFIYTLLMPYLKGEPIRPKDRHSFRFQIIKYLVDNWWTIIFAFLSFIILFSVFFIEVMIYPGLYFHLRSNNRIQTRRVVTIQEANQ